MCKQFDVGKDRINCFFIQSSKYILTWCGRTEKALFLDSDLNVAVTSDFVARWKQADVEIDDKVMFTMDYDRQECLALVDSKTMELYDNYILAYNNVGFCLCKLDDTHVVVGQGWGRMSLF